MSALSTASDITAEGFTLLTFLDEVYMIYKVNIFSLYLSLKIFILSYRYMNKFVARVLNISYVLLSIYQVISEHCSLLK